MKPTQSAMFQTQDLPLFSGTPVTTHAPQYLAKPAMQQDALLGEYASVTMPDRITPAAVKDAQKLTAAILAARQDVKRKMEALPILSTRPTCTECRGNNCLACDIEEEKG